MDADQQIILLQGCKPILARKIRYFEDPAFMARLLPPPEVPRIDMELFQQRIEGRMRSARAEDQAGDCPAGPAHPDDPPMSREEAGGEGIAKRIDKFFDALQLDAPLSPHPEHDEDEDENADAGRGRSGDRDLFER